MYSVCLRCFYITGVGLVLECCSYILCLSCVDLFLRFPFISCMLCVSRCVGIYLGCFSVRESFISSLTVLLSESIGPVFSLAPRSLVRPHRCVWFA